MTRCLPAVAELLAIFYYNNWPTFIFKDSAVVGKIHHFIKTHFYRVELDLHCISWQLFSS